MRQGVVFCYRLKTVVAQFVRMASETVGGSEPSAFPRKRNMADKVVKGYHETVDENHLLHGCKHLLDAWVFSGFGLLDYLPAALCIGGGRHQKCHEE